MRPALFYMCRNKYHFWNSFDTFLSLEGDRMATTTSRRGRPKGSKNSTTKKQVKTMTCCICGEEKDEKRFYTTMSGFYKHYGRIPMCTECVDDMFMMYRERYDKEGYTNPDKKAVKRICMALDVYYKDSLFESALKSWNKRPDMSMMIHYMKNGRLGTNRLKSYDDTIREQYDASKDKDAILSIYNDDDKELDKRVAEGQKLFGSGFSREDYIFLYEQYSDWTARHECSTKSQEELFKQICFTQLDLFKANRSGQDTKTLNDTLIKQLDAAKLQPKQNAGDTTADNQTLGTLIDKWENTRPIPEIDEELRDVDKIGRYISVFFFGHLCKMIGVDNDYARQYEEYMKSYTVDKPEYAEDDADEAIYHAMFGGDAEDE